MNLSLVKTATDRHTDAALAREAQWLRELEEVPELEGQVPRMLDEGTGPEGWRWIKISMAPSRGETRAFTTDHARFLASLGKARFRATDFEVSGCGAWLQRSMRRLEPAVDPARMAVLREAYHDCETALLYWTGPYVLSQGDFAPWNIRTAGSQLFVFDWGRARAEASPLDDVLHYLMVQRAFVHGTAPHGASHPPLDVPYLRAAMKRAQDFALQAYPEWPWRDPVIGALTLVYLLGVIVQQPQGPEDQAVGRYWNLVQHRSAWMPAAT